MPLRRRLAPAILVLAACQAAPDGATLPPEARAALDTVRLAQVVGQLADDSMLGRQPGTEGEARTVRFLESSFRALGLEGGAGDGSFTQAVPLVGITVQNAPTLTISGGNGAPARLRWRDDYVAWTKRVVPRVALEQSELVFVGYGTEAPEFGWDDYKGLDVRGKTIVMLVNDPPLADTSQFGGKAMTYYGRWTYKFEQGRVHGAAGVLLVHETGPAGYPWAVVQGRTGELFDLVTADSNRTRAAVEGWITVEQARALFSRAGQDFDRLKAAAATREFRPVPLGLTASVTLENALRRVDSRNVIARLPGSDSVAAKEAVLYTAHWDHFGVGKPVDGDSIYNGALDNATGTGGLLLLAEAFAKGPRPKRSIVFVAVTAEEQGLLGSEHYAANPTVPLADMVAVINLDGLNIAGRTRDMSVIGLGASELDGYATAALRAQQRIATPDGEPEKGFYYRSDHFNFARRGVPAIFPGAGVDVIGKPKGYGRQKLDEYEAKHYHAPSDEITPEWTFAGAVEDLAVMATMGWQLANDGRFPAWRKGHEFEAARLAQRPAAQ
jgi:Zn-dependent M28 family amino/carboxypeptidase